jgi:hypothetical protein
MTAQRTIDILIVLTAISFAAGCSATGPATSSANRPPISSESNPVIVALKNSVLTRYSTSTIGKAFEGAFQKAKWITFETVDGQVIVEFDGTVTMEALNGFYRALGQDSYFTAYRAAQRGCKETLPDLVNEPQPTIDIKLEECAKTIPMPVKFQFVRSADTKSFTISYIDGTAFGYSGFGNGNSDAEASDRVFRFLYP